MNRYKAIILNQFTAASIALSVCVLAGCQGKPGDKAEKETVTETTTDSVMNKETYQHVGIVTIKDEKWNEYVAAMQNNIVQSRKEDGNILFTLLQPEGGTHKVAFVERYKDRAALDEHSKADYIPKKLTGEAKIGEIVITEIKELSEVPAVEPANADEIYPPRNVLVFFDVKPEKRQVFIDAIAQTTTNARKAPGNVRFNTFQETADANKFVLVEGWESVAAHEAHLAQDYSKKFNEAVNGIFVSNPADTRWFAKDISK